MNLNEDMEDDFLWDPRRLEKLDSINSDNYRPIGTKHRPPIFSDYIEKVMDNEEEKNATVMLKKLLNFFTLK